MIEEKEQREEREGHRLKKKVTNNSKYFSPPVNYLPRYEIQGFKTPLFLEKKPYNIGV